VISAAENSNKFQRTRFCEEKSVEDVLTLGPMAQATLVHIKYILFLEFYFSLWKVDHYNKKSPKCFTKKLELKN
jgi:hypothetical protein